MSCQMAFCTHCGCVAPTARAREAKIVRLRAAVRDLATPYATLQAWSINGGCWCRNQYEGDLPMPQRDEDHDSGCRRVRAALARLAGRTEGD